MQKATSTPFCAAVDWGTTNFRLWLLGGNGETLAERTSAEGMRACLPDRFEQVLESHLAALGAPGDLPVIVAGMAGARGAWCEAPYLETPARLSGLHASAVRVGRTRRDVRILPGICQRRAGSEDVMRGEETQLSGAVAEGLQSALFCLPGTHSKWARVEGGILLSFLTCMTGELFSIVSQHSVLHGLLQEAQEETAMPPFREAVEEMLAGAPLTARLFNLRAAALLDPARARQSRARLSGLLIGAEIAAAIREFGKGPVVLVARGETAAAYETAIAVAGLEVATRDATDLTRGALHGAARSIWQEN